MPTIFAAIIAALATAAVPSAAPAQLASPTRATIVHMRDFAFVPKSVTIEAGSTLTIVNDDSEAHTATALDHSFDSAGLDTKESWTHVFSKPGTYPYLCELHPYMKGIIIVRPATSKGSP